MGNPLQSLWPEKITHPQAPTATSPKKLWFLVVWHPTTPHKPQKVASKPECSKSRSVDVQFKEAQQALTTELSKNLRPASLHWFEDAIITENDAEKLTISLGHEQVGWVQGQYSALLEGLMRKKVILSG